MPRHIRKIRVEGNIAYVPLTRGYEAIIDTFDVSLVEGFNWTALVVPHTVYARRNIRINGKQVCLYMHREILKPNNDALVDHRDCNGLNNRRANLRQANALQNARNQKAKINLSGFRGVYWDKDRKKWISKIRVDGKSKFLGRYDTPEAAYEAYCIASAQYHGEFGRT